MSSQSDDEDREEEEEEPHPTGNPAPPPDLDLEMLRGDRIGDTVYSGKWCIQTVMALMQSNAVLKNDPQTDQPENNPDMASQSEEINSDITDPPAPKPEMVDMEEDLQNQVGALWDMTSNEDVCEFLHSVGAIDSICEIITYSRCPRATEMCVGMLANIVTHEDMWSLMSADTAMFNTLIHQLTNTDQPSLVEVTRFFTTALSHKDHSVCYGCLWADEGLVTQELARILGGSTHGDLLKQTSELTLTLLTLDRDESRFCESLAHGEFVAALMEATREIGYEAVCPGQDVLIDVLYQLTTYTAGALALESHLSAVSACAMAYLRAVCQSLSLSNHSNTLTALVAMLDHVYCRSGEVQGGLFAAPKVIGHILKVLVTVYRRQGKYHLISDMHPSLMSPAAHRETSSWGDVGDTPTKHGGASWSERAGGEGAGKTPTQTPSDSPMTGGQRGKDLDVSWSERRVDTPQGLSNTHEEIWKRPRDRRKGRRSPHSRRGEDGERGSEGRSTSPKMDKEKTQLTDKEESESQGEGLRSSSKEDLSKTDNNCVQAESNNKSVSQTTAGGAQCLNSSYKCRRNSTGFSPQNDQGIMMSDHGDQHTTDNYFDRCDSSERVRGLKISSSFDDDGEEEEERRVNVSEGHGSKVGGHTTEDSRFDSDDDDDGTRDGQFEESIAEHTEPPQGDKYQALYDAVQEFLADFVNALTKALESSPSSDVKNTVRYLDKRCSSTEVRALFKCVGPTALKGHMEVIVEACEGLKVKHLSSILTTLLKEG